MVEYKKKTQRAGKLGQGERRSFWNSENVREGLTKNLGATATYKKALLAYILSLGEVTSKDGRTKFGENPIIKEGKTRQAKTSPKIRGENGKNSDTQTYPSSLDKRKEKRTKK